MDKERFNRLVQEHYENNINLVLFAKSKEYARGDTLSNFKKAGAARNTTPEDALLGMCVKHDISIEDLAADLKNGINRPKEMWEEKIGDAINYRLLLKALIWDRYGW